MTDRETLINNLNNYFFSFWANKGIDINQEKISTNKYNACMIYIYDNYISKLEVSNKYSKVYSCNDYITIVQWYISKSLENDFISLYGLALLLNRSINWFYSVKNNSDSLNNMFLFDIDINNNNNLYTENIYNNSVKGINNSNNISDVVSKTTCDSVGNLTLPIIDITNKVFEYLQQSTVSKLNDTPLGIVTNANNNKDVGLMYAKERIQETAKARALISLSDLPQLE